MSEIIIFEGGNQSVEVRLEGETLWLTQRQIGELFGTTPENILMHLRGVYVSEELSEAATSKDFLVVRQEGKRQVKRRLKHYNLDAIISVGYRVNSSRATRFRQWATRVLREHLTQGYSLNEYRLAQQGLAELEQAVVLLGQTLTRQQLVSDLGQEVVGLILGYARTWRLLQDYDQGALGLPEGAQAAKGILRLDEARRALDALGEELCSRGEASELFARDRGEGLAAILGNLEQTMFGDSLYRTREERAAHLLYFVIKNHPFSDGNKRSGAFLFLLYLRQEGMRLTLNEQGLTALTLLIAESDPKSKDLMVRLTMNLIVEAI
ncbi:virulence protein RhuM/Fic/DOC family protein [Pusillimonas noertemannii]|uniref:Fic/DOC family protein n=1 Tax=Pusillimonas noertemannii TaxID=305977 RepID=A0A2U1CK59_9BURK|nr:virulence protein RhuM/Fic/DOC family protein [Pusillimonas noertemannii]NYT69694.1 virulence protein RhuM/Fic/DOC family protein [Pusillimonas noertemannii]PVY61381.1 Fic/DOC family protein [Pusillimonas noertemannii]TFL09011.1 Fic/DOC family protein [Pusillimonas noertemannii]